MTIYLSKDYLFFFLLSCFPREEIRNGKTRYKNLRFLKNPPPPTKWFLPPIWFECGGLVIEGPFFSFVPSRVYIYICFSLRGSVRKKGTSVHILEGGVVSLWVSCPMLRCSYEVSLWVFLWWGVHFPEYCICSPNKQRTSALARKLLH